MRKMMEGVVLYGTGKPAQLNGYSSGGKTGTAQKIDPATHLYSKTMHIASFAGIRAGQQSGHRRGRGHRHPQGRSYYGTAVSAPVFAEVAQQVLEYLGVPHDIDLRPAQRWGQARKTVRPKTTLPGTPATSMPSTTRPTICPATIHCVRLKASRRPPINPLRPFTDQRSACKRQPQPPQPAAPQTQTATTVTIADGKTLRVPSLIGLPVRKVIEQAAAAGLEVQITGSGIVREQAPAAGSMVPPGTKIVVRCTR